MIKFSNIIYIHSRNIINAKLLIYSVMRTFFKKGPNSPMQLVRILISRQNRYGNSDHNLNPNNFKLITYRAHSTNKRSTLFLVILDNVC